MYDLTSTIGRIEKSAEDLKENQQRTIESFDELIADCNKLIADMKSIKNLLCSNH